MTAFVLDKLIANMTSIERETKSNFILSYHSVTSLFYRSSPPVFILADENPALSYTQT